MGPYKVLKCFVKSKRFLKVLGKATWALEGLIRILRSLKGLHYEALQGLITPLRVKAL